MVRRVVSIILFALGGWLLSSEVVMAWIDAGEGPGTQVVMLCAIAVFALPFLLLGTWASPGRRLAELGLTVMIVAGVGVAMALMTVMVLKDPSFKQLMPPDQPMPEMKFAPLAGILNGLFIGGIGYVLRLLGVARTHREEPAPQDSE